MIIIVAKALNVDLSGYTHKVECSYFTNHAFVRGEVIDVEFHFILAQCHSCWRGLARSSRVAESSPIYQTESEPQEELPQYQLFRDVPLLTYPLQSALGSLSDHPPIWNQILINQISMQGQLNEMDLHQK